MSKYPITSSDQLAGVDPKCLRDMLWESYYLGWKAAGRNRPCKPGELLAVAQKRAYRAGYYARCKHEAEISWFVMSLDKERE